MHIAFVTIQKPVQKNEYGDESIDFFNPQAVRALNTSLLKHFYNIDFWEIPENYLCPPVPGRADYIHHIAQLLGESNYGKTPLGNKIKCLDEILLRNTFRATNLLLLIPCDSTDKINSSKNC